MAATSRSKLRRSSQLLVGRRSQCVVAGASIVRRLAPLGLHPAFHAEPLQSRIQGSFLDLQDVARHLPQVLSDAVPMHLTERERAQDEHLESAGKERYLVHIGCLWDRQSMRENRCF